MNAIGRSSGRPASSMFINVVLPVLVEPETTMLLPSSTASLSHPSISPTAPTSAHVGANGCLHLIASDNPDSTEAPTKHSKRWPPGSTQLTPGDESGSNSNPLKLARLLQMLSMAAIVSSPSGTWVLPWPRRSTTTLPRRDMRISTVSGSP